MCRQKRIVLRLHPVGRTFLLEHIATYFLRHIHPVRPRLDEAYIDAAPDLAKSDGGLGDDVTFVLRRVERFLALDPCTGNHVSIIRCDGDRSLPERVAGGERCLQKQDRDQNGGLSHSRRS
ncbi:MAG: hypothetical protein CME19_20915 [Gemmatimonadetes bacterium]|nr:hypothetical protein [Gemmatimonadota bacterium]